MARGFCVLSMIFIHFLYDLTDIYRIFRSFPPFLQPVKAYGGIAFFLISGVCATLSRRPFRRGLTVLACAALVRLVTTLAGMPVRFGVLGCLGCAMVLWTLFRPFPGAALLFCAFFCILTGAAFRRLSVTAPFLYPLGLCRPDFSSADYFPLFPFLGYFLLGAVLGSFLYPVRRSLLPRFSFESPPARLLRFCGRHSLPLYLLHQPVLLVFLETLYFLGEKLYES